MGRPAPCRCRVSGPPRGPGPRRGPAVTWHLDSAHEHLRPPLHSLAGDPTVVGDYRGKALLVVNVASKCGLTPQYEGLERLQKTYGDKGFTVLGFPCNQFGEQEPGSSEEIATFCSATYGVTFPMFEKVEVNGDRRHPVYEELVAFPDGEGEAGDIQWNFEKFLVSPAGEIVQRFRPMVDPEAPEVIGRHRGQPAGLTPDRSGDRGRPGRRSRDEGGAHVGSERPATNRSSRS